MRATTSHLSDDPEPDTLILLKSVEEMIGVIKTQADCYNDTRRRLVDEHLQRPALSLVHCESLYMDNGNSRFDIGLLKEKLGIVAARLRQIDEERTNAQIQTDAAFKQLHAENKHLREQLEKLRKKYVVPSDSIL